jgi:hypothetical protein
LYYPIGEIAMTEAYYAVDVEGREPRRFQSGIDAGCYIWCNLPPCGGSEPQVYQCDGDGDCQPINPHELVAQYMQHFESLVYGLREQPDAGAVVPPDFEYDDPSYDYEYENTSGFESEDPGAIDTDLGYDNEREPGDEHYWGK